MQASESRESYAPARTQNLSVLAEGGDAGVPQSRLALSGGHYRLVFALCGGLGALRDLGIAVCAHGREAGVDGRRPDHLES